VAAVGLALLAALDAAHAEDVVHRDVKPSNVLLAERVVLTDFGIATSESDATLTATGLLVGSPTYMSPERLRGQRIGPPADIWSLGATLYAALEAHPPFRADTTMGTITAVLADEAPLPRIGGPLREAVLGMLEKAPDRRLTSFDVRPLLRRAVTVPSPPASWVAPAGDTTTMHLPPVTPVMAPSKASDGPFSDFFGSAETPDVQKRPPRRPGRRSRAAALMLAALLVLVAGGLLLAKQLAGDEPGATTASDDATQPRGDGSPGASRTTAGATATQTSPSPEPGPSVPAGYSLVRDELNFSVAIPSGWTRRLVAETRVDYVSPDGTMFLRIDQQPQAEPSAEQAWLNAESAVAARLPDYQRIRIDPVPYRYPAADWEFTWRGSGGRIHVLNRGIVTDPRGFALYMSGPDATWEAESLPVFEAAAGSFRPRV